MHSAMQFGVRATVCEDKTAFKKKKKTCKCRFLSNPPFLALNIGPCSATDEVGAIEIGFQGAVCIYIAIFFAC